MVFFGFMMFLLQVTFTVGHAESLSLEPFYYEEVIKDQEIYLSAPSQALNIDSERALLRKEISKKVQERFIESLKLSGVHLDFVTLLPPEVELFVMRTGNRYFDRQNSRLTRIEWQVAYTAHCRVIANRAAFDQKQSALKPEDRIAAFKLEGEHDGQVFRSNTEDVTKDSDLRFIADLFQLPVQTRLDFAKTYNLVSQYTKLNPKRVALKVSLLNSAGQDLTAPIELVSGRKAHRFLLKGILSIFNPLRYSVYGCAGLLEATLLK